MEFTKDLKNKKILVKKEFNAPIEEVWKAWTDSDILDQWWAPKPWKAETKKMDFRKGGTWIYAMVGPNGEKHYSRADFIEIVPFKTFSGKDAFCDEKGNIAPDSPISIWKNVFEKSGNKTIVHVELTFQKESDMQKLLEMGFEKGFEMGLGNLDELLEKETIKTH